MRNIRELVASTEGGANWISHFRKVPAITTIANQWYDFSGAAGWPVPNYFASSPLTAAVLEDEKGIYHGANVSPLKKHIHRVSVMNGAASATATTSQNMTLCLCDYLLYYPFADMDAAGEEQLMDNAVTLPRSVDGEGVRVMMVAQATTIGGGQFTFTYTNQDGVAGRVSPNHFCAAAQSSGALVSATVAASGLHPFLTLQDGDSGVRSIQSVTFSVGNGGLCALVLVKPLEWIYSREESRRETSGGLNSFGSAVEKEAVRTIPCTKQIEDGAYLNFIGAHPAGTIAGMQLVGTLETMWG
jgi:hypothetical protein